MECALIKLYVYFINYGIIIMLFYKRIQQIIITELLILFKSALPIEHILTIVSISTSMINQLLESLLEHVLQRQM